MIERNFLLRKIHLNLFQKDLLRSGAVVQLVSKNSGRLLQVVMSSNGTLVFDGTGSNSSFNSKEYSQCNSKSHKKLFFF
jgi:hypothetical protein